MNGRTLRQSLILSHVLVSFVPLCGIAAFILLFIIKNIQDDFSLRIATLAQGTRGQIQLYMDQPLSVLQSIGKMIEGGADPSGIERLLNVSLIDSIYFEAIYLIDSSGKVVNAGLPPSREPYREDLLGIDLGHKKEFRVARDGADPQWTDTFLSLSSGKISLTLFLAAGDKVLAADINLNTLAQLITRLSSQVVAAVIDRNGAIIIHPEAELMGSGVMMNSIGLVAEALQGKEQTGEFIFRGARYLGSTRIIQPTGWVCLFAEPLEHLSRRLIIPLLIFLAGLVATTGLSLFLALYRARRLARPITELTEQSSIIAEGTYDRSLPPSDIIELRRLADSINRMAESIRNREQLLLENELKYRELVESTSNFVVRLTPDLCITYVNHTIERLTGIGAAEAVGRHFAEMLVEEDRELFRKAAADWFAARSLSATLEVRLDHPDGAVRHQLLTANLHYREGELSDIGVIGHDITERLEYEAKQREMERQRQQSQKMEMLGLMAGGVAHDLNNILAGIINYPELLLLRMEPDNPFRPTILSIKKSGERAAAIVADLLTIARDSAAVHKVTNLNELVDGYCQSPELENLSRLHPEVRWTFKAGEGLWHCFCSPSHIEKTVMNLMTNAFEAVGAGGRVTIAIDNVAAAEAAVLLPEMPSMRYVRLRVGDSGAGIAPEDQERIFDPFFTKKKMGRNGTGLGLTVVWNTVREHGGTVTVASGPAGTEFAVYLPATEKPVEPATAPDELVDLCGHGELILVVDDEEQLREISVTMLRTLKYRAAAVGSGEEAIAYLENASVDLLLLDMLMEPGLSGRETFELVRRRWPGQKAVIATGFSSTHEVQATLRQGAGGFIKKPYSLTELGRALRRELRNPPVRPEPSPSANLRRGVS